MDKNINTDNLISEEDASNALDRQNIEEPVLPPPEANPESIDAIFQTDLCEAATPVPRHDKKRRNWINMLLNAFLLCIILFLLFLIVFMNIFILCPVRQESMLPNIQDGQRVLLVKTKKIKRQDIFVFKTEMIDSETGLKKNLIKRAIAIGGDRLIFVAFGERSYKTEIFLYRDTGDGFVLLDEDYIKEPMLFEGMASMGGLIYFDNTQTAETFDINAAVAAGLLDSHLITIRNNTIFAMGDNRNNSRDSRDLEISCIKTEDVIGRYYSTLPKGSFIEKFLKLLYHDTAAE